MTLNSRSLLLIALLSIVGVSHGFVVPQPRKASHRTTTRSDPSVVAFQLPSSDEQRSSSSLHMAAAEDKGSSGGMPFWLDIGTKGGAVFYSLVLFVVPILGYNVLTGVMGYDEIETGKWIGVGFTAIALLAWSSTYLFRVATKDMTYAKQLKDYENAVIAKRLEELDDDEVQALVEEIEREDF